MDKNTYVHLKRWQLRITDLGKKRKRDDQWVLIMCLCTTKIGC